MVFHFVGIYIDRFSVLVVIYCCEVNGWCLLQVPVPLTFPPLAYERQLVIYKYTLLIYKWRLIALCIRIHRHIYININKYTHMYILLVDDTYFNNAMTYIIKILYIGYCVNVCKKTYFYMINISCIKNWWNIDELFITRLLYD